MEHVASGKIASNQTQLQADLDMSYLDEAWPSLLTEDLTNFYSENTEQNMLNMYLLGLPQIDM